MHDALPCCSYNIAFICRLALMVMQIAGIHSTAPDSPTSVYSRSSGSSSPSPPTSPTSVYSATPPPTSTSLAGSSTVATALRLRSSSTAGAPRRPAMLRTPTSELINRYHDRHRIRSFQSAEEGAAAFAVLIDVEKILFRHLYDVYYRNVPLTFHPEQFEAVQVTGVPEELSGAEFARRAREIAADEDVCDTLTATARFADFLRYTNKHYFNRMGLFALRLFRSGQSSFRISEKIDEIVARLRGIAMFNTPFASYEITPISEEDVQLSLPSASELERRLNAAKAAEEDSSEDAETQPERHATLRASRMRANTKGSLSETPGTQDRTVSPTQSKTKGLNPLPGGTESKGSGLESQGPEQDQDRGKSRAKNESPKSELQEQSSSVETESPMKKEAKGDPKVTEGPKEPIQSQTQKKIGSGKASEGSSQRRSKIPKPTQQSQKGRQRTSSTGSPGSAPPTIRKKDSRRGKTDKIGKAEGSTRMPRPETLKQVHSEAPDEETPKARTRTTPMTPKRPQLHRNEEFYEPRTPVTVKRVKPDSVKNLTRPKVPNEELEDPFVPKIPKNQHGDSSVPLDQSQFGQLPSIQPDVPTESKSHSKEDRKRHHLCWLFSPTKPKKSSTRGPPASQRRWSDAGPATSRGPGASRALATGAGGIPAQHGGPQTPRPKAGKNPAAGPKPAPTVWDKNYCRN